ncbi:hypothetical protein ACEPAH_4938 [Sanghuangporus vaninii]
MSNDEREGGEITEPESPREKGSRDQRSYRDRDRERERPPRDDVDDWTREDRRHGDSYERRPDRDTYRRDVGMEDQYRPRRRTSPEPSYRTERKRSASRPRDDGGSRNQRRREDSLDSGQSGPRRGGDDWDGPSQVYRKRERSRSPVGYGRTQRRFRTNSPSPGPTTSRRRSPSAAPLTHRQEEKLPEHAVSQPRRFEEPPSKTSPSPERYVASAHIDTNSREKLDNTAAPSRHSPAPIASVEKSASPGKARRPTTVISVRAEDASVQSPTKTSRTPITPSAPRFAAYAQPSRKRSPKIPEWPRPLKSDKFQRFLVFGHHREERLEMYAEYARSSAELHRTKLEAEISAIELRSVELRRIFAEQQRQRALEA